MTATDLEQSDVETITRDWSLVDDGDNSVDPSEIKFVARPVAGGDDVEWTTGDGSVVDSNDGTGSWTITAGELTVGKYRWWALATLAGNDKRVPDKLYGVLSIIDR